MDPYPGCYPLYARSLHPLHIRQIADESASLLINANQAS